MFSVADEEEARELVVLACPTNAAGQYIARELAEEQTLDNLYAFGDRLATLHDEVLVSQRSLPLPMAGSERKQRFMKMKATMVLGAPLDQPERLACSSCGCDHFKINLEAPYDGTSSSVVNSVECERCHDIFAISVAVDGPSGTARPDDSFEPARRMNRRREPEMMDTPDGEVPYPGDDPSRIEP